MAGVSLTLPTIQNWSCHNCSGCCRQHAIEITDAERQRIVHQKWTEQDGIAAGQPLFEKHGVLPWRQSDHLAHQPDGACVFLNEQGLCRIHAKFGEDAKPLACRIYPYAFHPAGKRVTVSLRFSCPSVVANRGRALSENRSEIQRIAKAVVPDGAEKIPPPRISRVARVEWGDFLRIIDHLDAAFAVGKSPVILKLLRALFWIKLVDLSKFDKVLGGRLDDFLDLIVQAAADEFKSVPASLEPSRIGRVQFRMLTAQYGRKDTAADLSKGLRGRWRLFRAATRFARGTGNVPALQSDFREVPFEALERPFGGLPEEAEELFTRYFRVKIQGLHFCGPAYYDIPLAEGFQSLALILPAVLWIARWLAASQQRDRLQFDDVARALAIADHHHGYSPIFGSSGFRRRVHTLVKAGDLEKLCVWYSS